MIITKQAASKELKNNILTLAQTAKAEKDLDSSVINATIGMLHDEQDKFYSFPIVEEVAKQISNYDMYAYRDTDGGADYHQAIISWVFGDYLHEFVPQKQFRVLATAGGSGAIALTFANYLEPGDQVLLPNLMWETYITFAKERGCDYATYELFDAEGKFNLASIKSKIEELAKTQGRIVLVVNDPCQNPVGFCMKDAEYQGLVDLLNSYELPIVLLMDMAYFDYYHENGDIIRRRYAKLAKLNDHILSIFVFSGSKTFGLYGLRIGAAVAVSGVEQELNYFSSALEYSARNLWSSCSSFGIAIIRDILLKPENRKVFAQEIKEVSRLLTKRSKTFLAEAQKVNLPLLPFEQGFFLCVPAKDPVALMNKLHKYKVHVVVTKTCIRVALCAISQPEAKKLPGLIKKAMEELENEK